MQRGKRIGSGCELLIVYRVGGQNATPLTRSAATLEAVTPQVLQSTEQTVGIVVQTFGILNFGVQEFAGVDRQADSVVGVALRVAAELSKAGTFVSTVADVGGSKGSILLRGPAGRLSRAGVEGNFGLFGEQVQDLLTLAELQAVLTVQVRQTEPFDIGQVLFVEGEGSSVGSGQVQSGHLGGSFELKVL